MPPAECYLSDAAVFKKTLTGYKEHKPGTRRVAGSIRNILVSAASQKEEQLLKVVLGIDDMFWFDSTFPLVNELLKEALRFILQ